MNPAVTSPQLKDCKNADHDKERHGDGGRIPHVKGTKRLVVNIHDYRSARITRAAIGQSNDGINSCSVLIMVIVMLNRMTGLSSGIIIRKSTACDFAPSILAASYSSSEMF